MTATPEPPEVLYVDTVTVACDGNGPLGHPRVFLNLRADGRIDCPYCDRRFILRKGAEGGAH